jgi:hypothetical protein
MMEGGIAVLISVKTSRFTVHGVSASQPACLSLSQPRPRRVLVLQMAKTLLKARDQGFFLDYFRRPSSCSTQLEMFLALYVEAGNEIFIKNDTFLTK